MAENNKTVSFQNSEPYNVLHESIKVKYSKKAVPQYVVEFLKLKANNHAEVFHVISQYFQDIIPKYRDLTRNYVLNDRSRKGDFARWLAIKGDIYTASRKTQLSLAAEM